jgi:hypothetical protein
MSRRQITLGGYTFAELQIDEIRLSGGGGPDFPYLHWQIEMTVPQLREAAKDFALRVAVAELRIKSNGLKIATSRPYFLTRVIRGFFQYGSQEYLNLEFPVSPGKIAAIERHRDGGPLNLTLHVQIQIDEIGVVMAPKESNRPALWGMTDVHMVRTDEDFQIPQSRWVEQILPQLGYGKVHLIELPAVPLDACAAWEHSFKALKQAEEKHRLGFYDDAVGKCRIALDHFFEWVDKQDDQGVKRKVPILNQRWVKRLGQGTYDWLNTTLGSLKEVANSPHHSPNPHFDQLESQMIIAITTAVVAYAARTPQITPKNA